MRSITLSLRAVRRREKRGVAFQLVERARMMRMRRKKRWRNRKRRIVKRMKTWRRERKK